VHIAYVLHSLLAEIGGHHLYSEGEARSVLDRAEGEARSFLEDEAARVGASGGKVAETHLRTGQPDKEIVRLSEELGVGTIVIGSRGLGAVRRALMGGISESVVRHAHCPVFVVRGQDGAFRAEGVSPCRGRAPTATLDVSLATANFREFFF
jgi:nucleotide-binding universal stress UspA family protein